MDRIKIYTHDEAMVSDSLMDSDSDAINAALPSFKLGAVIYTVGYKKVKQKAITGLWELVTAKPNRLMAGRFIPAVSHEYKAF